MLSKFLRRTHSNNFQNEVAKKLHEDYGYRMIVFGHTHIPIITSLSARGHYCNTGSWTPVMNLLKYSESKSSYVEYLTAKSDFKKFEHSGTLRIELDLSSPHARPRFSLKTIQNGFE
jgi:predicted phosphodiesterase